MKETVYIRGTTDTAPFLSVSSATTAGDLRHLMALLVRASSFRIRKRLVRRFSKFEKEDIMDHVSRRHGSIDQ